MIPKHVEEKINTLSKSENASIENISKSAITLGYSLAMEEIKPILDASREVNKAFQEDQILADYVEALELMHRFSQLLKQYDEQR